jgi:hypothetical protein
MKINMKWIWTLLIIGTIFTICAPILFTKSGSIDFTTTGQIGDTIGGITAPIVGILGAALLFFTLLEQHNFNKQQSELTTEDQFKSTFFNLLKTQRDILTKITGRFTSEANNGDEISGLAFFKSAKNQLRLIYEFLDRHDHYRDNDHVEDYGIHISREAQKKYKNTTEDKKIGIGYSCFFDKYDGVGYYFRHLYHILKFIEQYENNKVDRYRKKNENDIREKCKQYAQFVQAQMSIEEMVLLFYDSFMFKKLQDLIIHYGLLENLSVRHLIKQEHNCKPELKLKIDK